MKRADRIRKNEEFSRIIGKRHSLASDSFIVYSDLRKEDHARAGISVSKKLGDAVERNRIKRQVREMIRSIVDFDSCPIDLIVIVRNGYLSKAFKDNKNNLENIVKKAIIKQYE
ncbi:MAG: ribonuclease P protein component [Erysipelotrichaceae bacterium]|nr:ribonuclease P protein component [Erysipelotrichaceae bacterium]